MTDREKELIDYAAEAIARAQMRNSPFPLDGPERISGGIVRSVDKTIQSSTDRPLEFMQKQGHEDMLLRIKMFAEKEDREMKRTLLTMRVSFITSLAVSLSAVLLTRFLDK